ncbi:hypothetical protein DRJ25_06115 [Candidatus Woesearchaeota archaeon]|nr:MAG: hypothetical protein DRJ25_06115 [Candidatus Woesearchaeota archaeon]
MKTQEDIIKELNDELDSIFNKYMLLMQAEIDKAKRNMLKNLQSTDKNKDTSVLYDECDNRYVESLSKQEG